MENNNYEALDELIGCVGEWILQDELHPGLINPLRLQQLQFTFNALRKMVEEEDVKLKCEAGEPFRSMGYISLESASLEFADCQGFSRAVSFADNIDFYPLINGKVKLVLTFHNITLPMNK